MTIKEPEGVCPDPRGFWKCNWIHEIFGKIPIPMWFLGAVGRSRKEEAALRCQIQETVAQG